MQWHKHPEYTSSLLDYANSTLTVAELDIVFTNRAANRISKEDKRTRTRLINELAGRVFRGTDYARIRQYQGSVQRRIQRSVMDQRQGNMLVVFFGTPHVAKDRGHRPQSPAERVARPVNGSR